MDFISRIKDLADVVRKIDNIELYQKILDLQSGAMEMSEENHKLKENIKTLEEKLSTQDNVIFRDNAYWKKSDNDGPFCVPCWDDKRRLVHMKGGKGHFHCTLSGCTYEFSTEEYIKSEGQFRFSADDDDDKYRKLFGI